MSAPGESQNHRFTSSNPRFYIRVVPPTESAASEPTASAAQPHPPQDGAVLSRRGALASSAFALAALLAGVAVWQRKKHQTLRLATGVADGTFYAIGRAVERALAHSDVRLALLATLGSVENVELLKTGRADLALVSSVIPAVEGVSLLCPLGEEFAHLLVRKSLQLQGPAALLDKRVSVGPARSGTRYAALSVLAHFGIREGLFHPQSLTPRAAQQAFERGEIDAIFLLCTLRDPVVTSLLARGDCELLSLGLPGQVGSALDGICGGAPSLQPAVIPVFAYGQAPAQAVGTVRGTTYLLARDALSPTVVARVTELLFREKVALARVDPSLSHLSESFDRAISLYPVHVGAEQYYRRDAPTIIERYSDPISLGISLLAVLWSGLNAWRTARQRARLHQLDDVHRECGELEVRSRAVKTREERRAVYESADALRTHAFDRLVAGKFIADDAFRVLVLRLDALIARNDEVPGMSLAPTPLKESAVSELPNH